MSTSQGTTASLEKLQREEKAFSGTLYVLMLACLYMLH